MSMFNVFAEIYIDDGWQVNMIICQQHLLELQLSRKPATVGLLNC